jgi:hypothetical protein
MTYAPPERFEISRVLARMFGVIARNFPVFAALALTLSGVPTLLAVMLGGGAFSHVSGDTAGFFGFGWLVNLLINTLLQASLIHGTISDLNGRPASLGDCLRTALRNLLPLIGIGIATTVAVAVGLVLFIVPGVILALALCVSAPAQVVEGHGVFQALARSSDLTRHHRGAILLLYVLYGIGFFIVRGLAEIVPLSFAFAAPGAADIIRGTVVTPVFQAASALIGAAGVASIYFELRTIKEGVGVEALAKAFE